MHPKSLYDDSHLVVAAIRVLEHQHKAPPAAEQVGRMLDFTLERTCLIVRRLVKEGALREVQSGQGVRLAIADHTVLETLPRHEGPSALDKELERFQAQRGKMEAKIASLKEKQEKKKKDLFAELEQKLKMKKDSPQAD